MVSGITIWNKLQGKNYLLYNGHTTKIRFRKSFIRPAAHKVTIVTINSKGKAHVHEFFHLNTDIKLLSCAWENL